MLSALHRSTVPLAPLVPEMVRMPASLSNVGFRTSTNAYPSQSEASIPQRPALESYASFMNKLRVNLPKAGLPQRLLERRY